MAASAPPGIGMTQPKGQWQWEQPPLITDPNQAIDATIDQFEPAKENLVKLMVAGVSVEEIVNTTVFNAFTEGKYSPDTCAAKAIDAYDIHEAARIIGEVNNGGDMVEHTLRTIRGSLPYTAVHATRGKRIRAEPIAALYEQGKVFHAPGLNDLEEQLVSWTPDSSGSPDRLDALVWAMTELSQKGKPNIRWITI